MNRRSLLIGGALAAASLPFANAARAQAWPSRPLLAIVPYPPGGSTDAITRQVAQIIAGPLGQNVLVENRAGGATTIAAQALASAAPDGHTFAVFDPSTVAMNQFLFRRLAYDPASFVPVTALARIPFGIMVAPNFPANTLAEFVAHVRANPGLNAGSSGAGNPVHLALEQFARAANVQLSHVPYRGGAPAIQDVIGGHLPSMMMDVPSAAPHIAAGRIKVIAVTSAARTAALPNVPTVAESGYPGFEASSWFSVFVPAGTPAAVVARLNAVVRQAVASPQLEAWIRSVSFEPFTTTPEELAAVVASDRQKYERLIREIGLTLD